MNIGAVKIYSSSFKTNHPSITTTIFQQWLKTLTFYAACTCNRLRHAGAMTGVWRKPITSMQKVSNAAIFIYLLFFLSNIGNDEYSSPAKDGQLRGRHHMPSLYPISGPWICKGLAASGDVNFYEHTRSRHRVIIDVPFVLLSLEGCLAMSDLASGLTFTVAHRISARTLEDDTLLQRARDKECSLFPDLSSFAFHEDLRRQYGSLSTGAGWRTSSTA